jgi:hypothetical protein
MEITEPRAMTNSRFYVARATTGSCLYISLVQRVGVKSTIQNFDSADGNFGKPRVIAKSGAATAFSILLIKKATWREQLGFAYIG